VSSIIRADLDRSGQFRSLPDRDMVERPTTGSEVNYPTWRVLRQDFLVVGRVKDAGDGSYRVEYELFDVAKQQRLLGFAMTARSNAMRDVAHQIADAVYEKILGVRGAFWTRIAYVTAAGVGTGTRYALMVADADGVNPQTVVRSAVPLLSPAWSPDGRKLAYVSFERGNSSIYIQDISTGARQLVASFRGINSGPAFSPDGRQLALTLSKSGNPEIYVMDLGSKALRQVTNQIGIDTAAVFSPDGGSLYFMSDRGGKPQIYQAPAGGGSATRISFQGSYNADPSISYDGKKIAVAQGNGNNYRIAMLDLSLGSPRWSMLSPGFAGRITELRAQCQHGPVRRPRGQPWGALRGLGRCPRSPAPGAGRWRRARARVGAVSRATLACKVISASCLSAQFPPDEESK
jgi:TolB protein